MEKTLDKGQFWDTFKNRAVVVTDLPPGRSRDLANRANEAEGRGDASLRTKAEYSALFDLLLDGPGSEPAPAELTLLDENGHVTAAGQAVGDYLYNSGRKGGEKDFVGSPYFTFIPWDYDNSFGIDYFDTQWQYTDIVDWPSNTTNYWRKQGSRTRTSRIPLVQNLLRNRDFLQYYLDHLEHLLDAAFTPDAISAEIGSDGDGGLWDRVCHAAYLESGTPYGQPFTGRQFTNDEVYLTGCKQNELRYGDSKVEGIFHYVRMRYDSAREQLTTLRKTCPRVASGATFSGMMETLPGWA